MYIVFKSPVAHYADTKDVTMRWIASVELVPNVASKVTPGSRSKINDFETMCRIITSSHVRSGITSQVLSILQNT